MISFCLIWCNWELNWTKKKLKPFNAVYISHISMATKWKMHHFTSHHIKINLLPYNCFFCLCLFFVCFSTESVVISFSMCQILRHLSIPHFTFIPNCFCLSIVFSFFFSSWIYLCCKMQYCVFAIDVEYGNAIILHIDCIWKSLSVYTITIWILSEPQNVKQFKLKLEIETTKWFFKIHCINCKNAVIRLFRFKWMPVEILICDKPPVTIHCWKSVFHWYICTLYYHFIQHFY